MKTCPLCKTDLDDAFSFCPEDGTTLVAAPAAVVLFCRACSAEYPLTFTHCPVHGAPLTERKPEAVEAKPAPEPVPTPAKDEAAPHLESTDDATDVQPDAGEEDQASDIEITAQIESPTERPSFRAAAIGTVIGLALFSIASAYVLYTSAARKPMPAPTTRTNQAQAAQVDSPFIPTPKDEPVAEEAAPALTEAPSEPAGAIAAKPAVEEKRSAKAAQQQQAEAPAAAPAPAAPARVAALPVSTNNPSATDLVLPRGSFGRIDARLVHLRATRTDAGYRYELTFNMQEQMGRAAQWDALSIATRSASGVSRVQTVPFYHRLGGSGTLTFTVSVEMSGRSQADWQGRIICTSIGSDDSGQPVRASFGASVTP